MRTLSLLRHAKSSRDDAGLPDHERPLAARGRKAAPLMGRQMHKLGLKPDLVLCSTAVRTRETAALVLAELARSPPPVTYDERIYEASPDALLACLSALPARLRHVMIVGHNPGLQELILLLVGALPGAHARIAEKLPTGALVVLACDVSRWRDLGPRLAQIVHDIRPRDLES